MNIPIEHSNRTLDNRTIEMSWKPARESQGLLLPKFYSRNASLLYFKYSIYIIMTYWLYGIHVNNLGKFFVYNFNSMKTTKIDCLVTINHRYSSKWSNVSNGSKEIKIFHDISISSNKQHFTSPYSTRLPAELLIEYPCATRSMTLQQKVFVRQNRSKMELGCQRPPLQKGEVGRGQSYPATEAQRTGNSHWVEFKKE